MYIYTYTYIYILHTYIYANTYRSVKSLMLKAIDNLVAMSDPGNPHRMELKKEVREAADIFELLR